MREGVNGKLPVGFFCKYDGIIEFLLLQVEINVSLRFYVKNLQTRLLCGLTDLGLTMIFRKLEDFFAKNAEHCGRSTRVLFFP